MSSRWEGFIGVGQTLSTDVLTDAYYVAVENCGMEHTAEIERSDTAQGDQEYHRETKLMEDIAGNIELAVDRESIGYFLKYLIGDAGSPTGSGPYTHTFSLQDAMEEFYVRRKMGTAEDKVWGKCKINQGTFTAAQAQKLMASFDVVGYGVVDAGTHSAPSFTDITVQPFVFKQLDFYLDDHSTWPPTTEQVSFESFECVVNRNLVTDKRTANNSYLPSGLPEGKREISGSFTLEYENSDLYDDLLNEQELMMFAQFTDGANSLTLKFPRVRLTSHDRGAEVGGGNDRNVATVEWDALYDATETYSMQAVLTNQKSSAY